ncbi:MAG: DUF5723 family protein [Bacteroidota bacterium]
MAYKKLLFLFLSLSTMLVANAQINSLTLFPELPQYQQLHPAQMSVSKWTIALPSITSQWSSQPLRFDDLVNDGKVNLSPQLHQLVSNNSLHQETQIESIRLHFKPSENRQWSVHHAFRTQSQLLFSDLTARFLYDELPLSSAERLPLMHDAQLLIHQEIGIGYTQEMLDGWSWSVRAKGLHGIAEAKSVRPDLTLLTSMDTKILSADYYLRGAAILEYDEFESIRGTADILQILSDLARPNFGWALDFGGQARVGDWQMDVSLLDIGQLYWRKATTHYRFAGRFQNSGQAVLRAYLDGSSSFEMTTDSLRSLFAVIETNEAYTTWLPTRFASTFRYDGLDRWSISGHLRTRWWMGDFQAVVGGGIRCTVAECMQLGTTYFFSSTGHHQLGSQLVLKWKWGQFFVLSDQVGSIWNIRRQRQSHFQIGGNLLLGME